MRFAYEPRPDIALLYSGSALIQRDKRLTKVKGFQGEVSSGELRLTYGVSITQKSILLVGGGQLELLESDLG